VAVGLQLGGAGANGFVCPGIRTLLESMSAYAGTYTADGEKVVHCVDTSWNGSWTGTDQVRFYKLDGDTLTITTAPLTAFSGEEVKVVLVWKKVH
jgi:hypothetical protein